MVQTRQIAATLVAAVAMASSAGAITHSDRPASIQVWPKIVVDTSGRFSGGVPVNTLLTMSNTDSANVVQAHCFYVNGNSHCADNPARVCRSASDCTTVGNAGTTVAECDPGWNEMDFNINLTLQQPLEWYANGGLQRGQFPIEGPFKCNSPFQSIDCTSDLQCFGAGCNGVDSSNLGSGIPPVPEDPFIGSLTCLQWDPEAETVQQDTSLDNMLIGDATIIEGAFGARTDVAKYNAVGLAHLTNLGTDANQDVMNLDDVEFAACPSTLVLSFLFDGAVDPLGAGPTETVSTDLTLVPCANDFAAQVPGRTTAQFLVFTSLSNGFRPAERWTVCLMEPCRRSIRVIRRGPFSVQGWADQLRDRRESAGSEGTWEAAGFWEWRNSRLRTKRAVRAMQRITCISRAAVARAEPRGQM